MEDQKTVPVEEWLDISDEKKRVYCFPDMQVTIVEPAKLKVTRKEVNGIPMDSHRVLDKMNVAHYIPVGWRRLYWTSVKKDPFLF